MLNLKKKLGPNWKQIKNISTKLNIKNWLWHVAWYWLDTWIFFKLKKKLKKLKKNHKMTHGMIWAWHIYIF